MANILVVEDEISINELIQRNLRLVGHKCYGLFNGNDVEREVKNNKFDLAILDIMLHGLDGFQIIELIKKELPVIFLTAKDSLQDKIKGLTLGADDYIVKPFEMLELIARVDTVLRRTCKSSTFEFDNIKIDFNKREIYKDGSVVICTPKEYELFDVLVRNRNIAMSREKLLELAWGYDFEGDTRTVDVHIQKLRRKLEIEDKIKTVYKLGYRFEV